MKYFKEFYKLECGILGRNGLKIPRCKFLIVFKRFSLCFNVVTYCSLRMFFLGFENDLKVSLALETVLQQCHSEVLGEESRPSLLPVYRKQA